MQAVILVGGLGTRLRPLTETIPKPMIPVRGRPFLEYEILLLKNHGLGDFVLCEGYLGEQIERYFGDGKRLGVNIRYSRDGPNLLGPAGALNRAEQFLEDSFIVTYGDAYLRTDYQRVMNSLLKSNKLGVMVVYENRDRYGKSDIVVKDGYVEQYNKIIQNENMTWINFGVTALRKNALQFIPEGKEFGEEAFYGELIKRRELLAFPTSDRFYEIGNPNSLREFEEFISHEPTS